MQQWKTQEQAVDYSFLNNAQLQGDVNKIKTAFGFYAFPMDDNHNPWGKKDSINFYSLVLSMNSGCGGLIPTRNCADLQIETQDANAALLVAQNVNAKMHIIDSSTGDGKSSPAAADITQTDPATNENFFPNIWAVADGSSNTVNVYAP